MIITIEKCKIEACGGAEHRFEFDRPTAREILRIETATGMDVDAWAAGLDAGLANVTASGALMAMLALVDVCHRRIGVNVPFDDVDVDLFGINIAFESGELEDGDDDGDGAGDEAGKDDPAPTKPSPRRAAGAGRASTSGAAKRAASGRKSTRTARSSGGSTA